MDKDIQDFLRYGSLIISAIFLNKTIEYYIPIEFTSKYSWIGAILFAFIFYLASKKK